VLVTDIEGVKERLIDELDDGVTVTEALELGVGGTKSQGVNAVIAALHPPDVRGLLIAQ